MIDQLELLAEILTEAVATVDPAPDVIVTAGRPAAPSSEGRDCQTVVYVWGQQVSDLNQDDPNACIVVSRWTMFYEIHSCYPEDWNDRTGSDDAAEAAAALYNLMSLVWWGLVAAKDAGELCASKCFVELAPLEVQPRLGGAVSALGAVTIPITRPAEDSPASP